MVTRTRSRQEYHYGYYRRNATGVVTGVNMLKNDEFVEDVVQEGDNHAFDRRISTKSGGILNGKQTSIPAGYEYVDCPVSWHADTSVSHGNITGLDYNALASSLLKRTSPERSSMESMVSLVELRELPGLRKQMMELRMKELFKFIKRSRWRSLAKGAKLNLMIQFGILPILGDLDTLLTFQLSVDKRVAELERLKTRGLRRTVDLWKDSNTYRDANRTVHSSPTRRCDLDYVVLREVRGHIRWYADDTYIKSDEQMRAVAKKAMLGKYIDFTTVYELMPWSWLIDYFTNLGDFVSAGRNTIGSHHSNPRMMTHMRTIVTGSAMRDGNGSTNLSPVVTSPIRRTRETKLRTIATPTLAARMTFLTGKQTSILGSLAVARL